MTLLVDRRAELGDSPGFHALIAGVSAYRHLPGGPGPIARQTFGLPQLSSAALTAHRIAQWIEQNQQRLPVPLATCRALWSPSDIERDVEPALSGAVERCTLDNFLRSAAEWREDALRHPDGATWLYLVGLSFEIGSAEQILLLEDFGDGIGALLRNAVSVSNLVTGMAASRQNRVIARRQWYFLDLSRDRPRFIDELQWRNATPVFDADVPTLDDREAAVYYAAEPGGSAYAYLGDQSLFSKALIHCLDGAAGVRADNRWAVTSTSLAAALDRVLSMQAKDGVRQRVTVSGSIRNGVICYLDHPPLVDTTIRVEPIELARGGCRIEIWSYQTGEMAWSTEAGPDDPLVSAGFRIQLEAGFYQIRVSASPADSDDVHVVTTLSSILPPTHQEVVTVSRMPAAAQ